MVIYVLPADLYGCGWYRLLHSSRVLVQQGHDVRVIPPNDRRGIRGTTDDQGNLVDIEAPADADVMVFQRVTHRQIADGFPILRRRGIAVVIDIDDDLDRIDPRNPAWSALHPKISGKHSWVTAGHACANATMVTVSTPALLKRYAPHGNGVVLPNFIPAEYLSIPRHDTPVFGWGGSLHSHPGDLQVMGDAPARLMREGGLMRVVGPPDGIRNALGLPFEPDSTGALPIDRWALGLSTLGVGMTPLADTVFNDSKSRLKFIEKASLGIPVVFTPKPDYLALHKETGVGVPASKPKDWYRELKRFVEDATLRAQESVRVRQAVAHLTYEHQAWRWMQVWEDALKRQRSSALVRR